MGNKDLLLSSTLKTLLYSQMFSFPLNKKELFSRLITPPPASFSAFARKLKTGVEQKKIATAQGYYFLPGKEKTVSKRIALAKNYQSKYKLAKKAASFLAQIPEIQFVGLTGNLALGIAKPMDDIDLMIITSPNALWLTRLKIYYLLKSKGGKEHLWARKPKSKIINNQLCLNLFLDASDLVLEPKQQNLFTAYQIAFIKPLINKNQTFEQFLAANCWAQKFLPNAFTLHTPGMIMGRHFGNFSLLNLFCYHLQRLYMKGKPKAKKITPTQAFFHPQDQSTKTLKRFRATSP